MKLEQRVTTSEKRSKVLKLPQVQVGHGGSDLCPEVGRQRQADKYKFKASLVYIVPRQPRLQ